MNRDTIRGSWNVTKGRLKKKFAQLTDNDLTYIEGEEDELLGRLQKKTGQTRDELERFIHADRDPAIPAAPDRRHPFGEASAGLPETELERIPETHRAI